MKPHRWLALASVILFGIALVLPFEADAHETVPTWWKILTGWIYVLALQTTVWLSFVGLWASWVAVASRRYSIASALAALALGNALLFLQRPAVTYGWGDSIRTVPQTPQLGYYVLVASIIASLAASLAAHRRATEPAPQAPPPAPQTPGPAAPGRGRALAVAAALVLIPPAMSLLAVVYRWVMEPANAPYTSSGRTHQPTFKRAPERPEPTPEQARLWAAQRAARTFHFTRPREAINAAAHAPVGVPPDKLRIERRPREVHITSNYDEPVKVEAWFAFDGPSGVRVICRHYPRGYVMADGSILKLKPGQSGIVQLDPFEQVAKDCAAHDGKQPLYFLVMSDDFERPLFASDNLFAPAPPPAAERLVRPEYLPG